MRTVRATARHLAFAAAAGAALLTACAPGGDGSEPATLGEELYSRNCRSCHGADGGGGFGRKLSDGAVAKRYPEVEDVMAVIRDGKGSMPAWDSRMTEDEIRAVAEHVRTL